MNIRLMKIEWQERAWYDKLAIVVGYILISPMLLVCAVTFLPFYCVTTAVAFPRRPR